MSAEQVTITLIIEGMTCVNCENKIQRKLSKMAGVQSVEVSFSKGTVTITYNENEIHIEQIKEIIEKLDYHVVDQKHSGKDKGNFDPINLIGVLAVLAILYMLMSHLGSFGIFNAFPIAEEGMGLGMLFLIGVLTSVHCVAMCGGICLSQCIPKEQGNGNVKSSSLKPSLYYNLGRVISYTVIGGIVGAIGSVVSFSGNMKGIVQIVAGIFMVIMGINMLGILPWLRRFNPRMPRFIANKIPRGRSNNALLIGLLNGLMPCGPLQAMQLYALSTGSPLKGALSMFLFSIGTVPLMFGFGALSTVLNKKFTKNMMKVSAALVVMLGVYMFQTGTSLSGYMLPSMSGAGSKYVNAAVVEEGVQTVTTTLSSGNYEPITVQAGVPVKWVIQANESDINGCNYSIVIPEYGIQVDLQPGDNVIEFTPDKTGSYPFSCWMGMIRSQIQVVEDLSVTNGLDDLNANTTDDAGANSGTTGTVGGGSCCQ
ncbi:MAG TPA: sulfite exporter TauE/SafE family protein [Lachnospiraceae bacterium]|nr:sulfite exporter TauE/SafE family protein [Lachnospiraceae bacterium]